MGALHQPKAGWTGACASLLACWGSTLCLLLKQHFFTLSSKSSLLHLSQHNPLIWHAKISKADTEATKTKTKNTWILQDCGLDCWQTKSHWCHTGWGATERNVHYSCCSGHNALVQSLLNVLTELAKRYVSILDALLKLFTSVCYMNYLASLLP